MQGSTYHGNKVSQCRSCYKYGHVSEDCRFRDTQCRVCGGNGHLAEDCPANQSNHLNLQSNRGAGLMDPSGCTEQTRANNVAPPRSSFEMDPGIKRCPSRSSHPISLFSPENIIQVDPTHKTSPSMDNGPMSQSRPVGEPRSLFETDPIGQIIHTRESIPSGQENISNTSDTNKKPISLLSPKNLILIDPTKRMACADQNRCPGPATVSGSGNGGPANPVPQTHFGPKDQSVSIKHSHSMGFPRPLFDKVPMGHENNGVLNMARRNENNSLNSDLNDPISLLNPRNLIRVDPTQKNYPMGQDSRPSPVSLSECDKSSGGPHAGHHGPVGSVGPFDSVRQTRLEPVEQNDMMRQPIRMGAPRSHFERGVIGPTKDEGINIPSRKENSALDLDRNDDPISLLNPKNLIKVDPTQKMGHPGAGSWPRPNTLSEPVGPVACSSACLTDLAGFLGPPNSSVPGEIRESPMGVSRHFFDKRDPMGQSNDAGINRESRNENDSFKSGIADDPISLLNPRNLIKGDPIRKMGPGSGLPDIFLRPDGRPPTSGQQVHPGCGEQIGSERKPFSEARPLLETGSTIHTNASARDVSLGPENISINFNTNHNPRSLLDPQNIIADPTKNKGAGVSSLFGLGVQNNQGPREFDSQQESCRVGEPSPLFAGEPIRQMHSAATGVPSKQNNGSEPRPLFEAALTRHTNASRMEMASNQDNMSFHGNNGSSHNPKSLLDPTNIISDPTKDKCQVGLKHAGLGWQNGQCSTEFGFQQESHPKARPLFDEQPIRRMHSAGSDIASRVGNNFINCNTNDDPISLLNPRNIINIDPTRKVCQDGPVGQINAMKEPNSASNSFTTNGNSMNNHAKNSDPISLFDPKNIIKHDPKFSRIPPAARFEPYSKNNLR